MKPIMNLESNLVSVIIPCYNQARFLGEAIESILAQSHSNVELIVVDDGSTDHTFQVAAQFSGVRLIRQTNQGLSAARNRGIRESQGGYLVFLDADDRLLPGAIETGLKALKASPDCAFVSGHYRLIQADGTPMRALPSPCTETNHFVALLRGNYIGMHATVMHRRSTFDRFVGFDTTLKACEDYDLYLRIARDLPIRCHHKLVAEYRQHGNNMSRDARLMLRTSLAVFRLQRKIVSSHRDLKEAYQTGIRHVRSYYAQELLKQIVAYKLAGQWRCLMQGVLTLLRYHPQEFANQAGRKLSQKMVRAPKYIVTRLFGSF